MAAPALGTGASFTYSGLTGNIMSISCDNLYEREVIKTSHLGTTTAHTFIPGSLYDAGGCTIEFQTDSEIAYSTPATGAAAALTITFQTGFVFTASAFITSISPSAELETLQTMTVTFKFTSTLSHT